MNSMHIMLLVAASLFSCGAFASDLQSRSIVLSPYAEANMYTAGDHVSAHWECVNSGADIPETFYIAIYVDGRLVDRESKSGLKRDEVISGSYSLGELTVGSHSFTVIFDSENAIEETSEGNNVSSAMISVKDPDDPQSGSGGSSGNPEEQGGGIEGDETESNKRIWLWTGAGNGNVDIVSCNQESGDMIIPSILYSSEGDSDWSWGRRKMGHEYCDSSCDWDDDGRSDCYVHKVCGIADDAFCNSSITSVVIPSSVRRIGSCAFRGCEQLGAIAIQGGVTNIGSGAFLGCSSLKSVSLPNGITTIMEAVFAGCTSLTSVSIPNGITNIGGFAFENCRSLVGVTLPDGVTSIDGHAFRGCNSLESVAIPDSVRRIGFCAFCDCSSLTSITIPNGVTSIEDCAFKGCSSLESVKMPTSVGSILRSAFEGCTKLSTVTIPNSVTNIGERAFKGCNGLADKNGFVILHNVLYDYVLDSFYAEVPNCVTGIAAYAFERCANLELVVVPPSVTCWESCAFSSCNNLKLAFIPKSIFAYQDHVSFAYDFAERHFHVQTVFYEGDTPDLAGSKIKFDENGGVREGWKFIGWYTQKEGGEEISESTKLTSELTLYAHYEEIPVVTVVFEANGGECLMVNKDLEVGEAIGYLPDAERVGFSFVGWYTQPEGGIQISSTTIMYDACTLYAHWVQILGPTRFSGDADWTQESNGLWRSGHVEDWGRTAAIMDVVGPCIMSFKWKTSSEINYDGLHFYIDGEEYEYWISGEWGDEWDSVNVEVSTVGVVELKWEYRKDVSISEGEDCGWIKDIDWTPIVLIPTINDDEGAVVTGELENGFVVKPSEGKKDVVVTIPEGVDPDKVTVEVAADVETVKANGANVKVMNKGHDIAGFLDLEAVTQDGVINIAEAKVKDDVVKEALDTASGADIKLSPTDPSITTANTRPGLKYTFVEGQTIEELAPTEQYKWGDNTPFKPTPSIKGGTSGFYTIKVEK